jgi:hypothetical protein
MICTGIKLNKSRVVKLQKRPVSNFLYHLDHEEIENALLQLTLYNPH